MTPLDHIELSRPLCICFILFLFVAFFQEDSCDYSSIFAIVPSLELGTLYEQWHEKILPMYSISQEICTLFLLCCALLWLYTDWFTHTHQAYFAGTVAILTIAPVPAKQPWWIWVNSSWEVIMNDYLTATKQSTTKPPCAYFLGYTVAMITTFASDFLGDNVTTQIVTDCTWVTTSSLLLPSRFSELAFKKPWIMWENWSEWHHKKTQQSAHRDDNSWGVMYVFNIIRSVMTGYMMTHRNPYHVIDPLLGNPLVIDGFLSKRASNAHLWCFLHR